MTTEELFELIDGCRARGVAHIKLDIGVEFTLAPTAPARPDRLDAIADEWPLPERKVDPSKCLVCQVAAHERGALCRACYLAQAGVSS